VNQLQEILIDSKDVKPIIVIEEQGSIFLSPK
jgi:hypothetical protein